jgi:hypothetical protein
VTERLRTIGDQLAAIDQALQIARQETESDRREQLLDVVERAVDVARAEHQAAEEEEQRRPVFRVIQGGAVAALIAAIGGGMRSYWQQHRSATVAAMATSTAAPMLLYLVLEGGTAAQQGGDGGEEFIPTPTVMVTHSPAPPQPTSPGQADRDAGRPIEEARPTGQAGSGKPTITTRELTVLDSPVAEPRRSGRGTDEAPPPGLVNKDAHSQGGP